MPGERLDYIVRRAVARPHETVRRTRYPRWRSMPRWKALLYLAVWGL